MGLISRVSSRTYRNQTPFKMAESYVEALEKKVAELAGIPMEAIRKNKWNDLMNEGDAIKESTDFINNIVVAKQANATASKINPLISKIFGLVEREAKQAGGAAMLPELGYGYDALLPHICADIMEIHHSKHHQGYVNMKPNATENVPVPAGSLGEQIVKDFGSFEAMKDQFCANTAAVKGSGWGWLAYDQKL